MDDHHHQVRMHLDVIIGEAKPDNTKVDREHIRDLAGRVGDLNARLRDIRKEQRFQREREAAYRDLSERANFRALIWPTVQAMVLVATCAWQATHLRVSIVAQERASYIADTPRTSHVRHSSTTARSGEEQWRWLLLLCFADASLLRSGCGCASRDRREGGSGLLFAHEAKHTSVPCIRARKHSPVRRTVADPFRLQRLEEQAERGGQR